MAWRARHVEMDHAPTAPERLLFARLALHRRMPVLRTGLVGKQHQLLRAAAGRVHISDDLKPRRVQIADAEIGDLDASDSFGVSTIPARSKYSRARSCACASSSTEIISIAPITIDAWYRYAPARLRRIWDSRVELCASIVCQYSDNLRRLSISGGRTPRFPCRE